MSAPYTCQQIVEVVTEYLDGGLETSDRVAFERHVAICPPCRGYLSQIRWVSRVAGGLRADELPEHVRDGLLSAFAEWKDGRPT
jgi:predicted anti-sigma-YlaC factor YlaD